MNTSPANSENRLPPTRSTDGDAVTVAEYLAAVRANWLRVFAVTVAAAVLTAAASYLLPKSYTATTTLLPPQSSGSMGGAALASLGSLAGLVGGGAAFGSNAERYVALLQSTTITDRIIDRFGLQKVYEVELRSTARKRLASDVSITASKKDGLISISVDSAQPDQAVEMSRAYVEELRRLNGSLTLTEAQQRRAFFERQLQQTRDQLAAAQGALQSSGFNPGTLKVEPKAAAEAYARLKAEVASADIRLKALSTSLTPSAPEVRAQQELLSGLKGQLAKAEAETGPSPGTDYVSRYREFKYHETLFELYARQFELARADESREGAFIQVVDEPTLPDRTSKPKRALLTLSAALLALLLVLGHIAWRLSVRSR